MSDNPAEVTDRVEVAAGIDVSTPSDSATVHHEAIASGRTALGIELGSTRIKAVLIDLKHHVQLAAGSHSWENQFVDQLWTYSLEQIWAGVQAAYAALADDVHDRYGIRLAAVGAIGISAMMHGYLAFDADGELLVPFRTWRNTNTTAAVEALSAAFAFNIPHRWSVAHLYQAVLDDEPHVDRLGYVSTLAGYIHWQLTGEKVIGVGDASGMFPLDGTATYDPTMLATLDQLLLDRQLPWRAGQLLPTIRIAGEPAGQLTEHGRWLLDPTGGLAAGAPLCPPEGDAGTGMVATNSISPRTGNTSVGTSIFAMVVLEEPLSRVHHEIDIVATPTGAPVAMVHCNNGASELNAWAGLFAEFAKAANIEIATSEVFKALFRASLRGAPDGGGLLAYNNLSGEPITGLTEGRPLFLRRPDSTFDLATFIRTQIYAAFATLRVGLDVLRNDEGVRLDAMFAHGGLFTTKGVAQQHLANAIGTPVSVNDAAAEGGAWGIAVLAAYVAEPDSYGSLSAYLGRVFADTQLVTSQPDQQQADGFDRFMTLYMDGLAVQRAAIEHT